MILTELIVLVRGASRGVYMKNTKIMGTVLAVLMLVAMTGCTFLADDNFTPVTKISELAGTWEYSQTAKQLGLDVSLAGYKVDGKADSRMNISKVNNDWVMKSSYTAKWYLTTENGTFSDSTVKTLENLVFKTQAKDDNTGASAEYSLTLSSDKKTITVKASVESPKVAVHADYDADISVLNLGGTVQINSMGNRLKIGEGDDALTLKKKGLF